MKTLYCYISHILTDRIVKNFLDIKESIKHHKNSDIVFVLTEGNNSHIKDYIGDSMHICLNLDDVDLIDTKNYKSIHNHIIYIEIFNKNKSADTSLPTY